MCVTLRGTNAEVRSSRRSAKRLLGVELECAFVGCADQVLQRPTRRNHVLAQGGLGNFGAPVNLQFDPKELVLE